MDPHTSSDTHAESEKKTHFGFQEVPWSMKSKKVHEVFDSVAPRYDLMNDLMSFGIHRLWKYLTVSSMRIRPGHTVLDLAGGTGDFSLKLAHKVGSEGNVILGDINRSMMEVGRSRIEDEGLINRVRYLELNAECLPLASESLDAVIIAFGLRNVTDKEAALREMARVLKPGGAAFILEFSHPTSPLLKSAYDFPTIGRLVANDADSYQYLAESIRKHPDQETLKNMMLSAGFDEVSFQNYTGGVVALHEGRKY
jgi:demethylmenaquinone methyltransferase/2-methoxy-6-polyprenyl-1,4-benzoquinol methylase